MHFQWYPGHMTKARRMMQENIKLIDIVVELVDARVPFSSKNPDIDELAKNKYRLIVLNKADMADAKTTAAWQNYFEAKGFFVAKVNSQKGAGMKEVKSLIEKACQEKKARDKKRGILNRPLRAMVVGIPNVGKSTFINSFAGKACAKTGNKPGVTKGKQWIKINKNVELLDTPGILWPKFEDQAVGLRLALIGSIKEEILNTTEMAMEFIGFLKKSYPGVLVERYSVDESKENLEILEEIARIRGCLMKGNQTDIDKAGRLLLEDFRLMRSKEREAEKKNESEKKEKSTAQNILGTIAYIVGVCVFVFLILHFVGQRTVVNGSSMDTTLANGQNLVMDKLSYRFHDPERYDIIIFPGPEEFGQHPYYIKRIIGMPGETVQIKDGKVYINDKELKSDVYGITDYIDYPGIAEEPITLGDDEYFCLGDNRPVSQDSRYEEVGPVKRSIIVGKVWIRIWPLNKFGKVS